VKYSKVIVLWRKIAVSIFASECESSCPPAEPVMPSATPRWSGASSGLGPPPGDLLQGEPQRLGVGELAVEQRQRGGERGELRVGELDRGEMEVLRAQRVVLLLGDAVDRLLDRQRDAQRLELRAVGVEAAREGVLVHPAVALDVPLDVERGDRPALGHQVGDQRELADQLLGVLGHPGTNHRRRLRHGGGRRPYLRALPRRRGA
jgi:hypothetical protein